MGGMLLLAAPMRPLRPLRPLSRSASSSPSPWLLPPLRGVSHPHSAFSASVILPSGCGSGEARRRRRLKLDTRRALRTPGPVPEAPAAAQAGGPKPSCGPRAGGKAASHTPPPHLHNNHGNLRRVRRPEGLLLRGLGRGGQLRLLLCCQRRRVAPVLAAQHAGDDEQAERHRDQEADAADVGHCGQDKGANRRAGGVTQSAARGMGQRPPPRVAVLRLASRQVCASAHAANQHRRRSKRAGGRRPRPCAPLCRPPSSWPALTRAETEASSPAASGLNYGSRRLLGAAWAGGQRRQAQLWGAHACCPRARRVLQRLVGRAGGRQQRSRGCLLVRRDGSLARSKQGCDVEAARRSAKK